MQLKVNYYQPINKFKFNFINKSIRKNINLKPFKKINIRFNKYIT